MSAPDIIQSAKQTIEAFENAYRDRGIKLRLDPAVKASANWRVTGESSRLERIFGNLLENALRYSPKGTTVTIGIEDQGGSVRASVNDEGPGLPTDKPQSQMFQLFARGKAHSGKAGLGLYFEKSPWSVGAERLAPRPALKAGSRFWFRLPRASGAAQVAAAAAPTESKAEAPRREIGRYPKQGDRGKAAKPLRVLVADDADLNRELVIELLEKHGYTAAGVSDGRKVLAALEREQFDAVLMDEEMPHMTGVEATLAIREKEKGGKAHQFIIGLTGNATAEDERRMLEAGMDAFLTKPIHMQKLYQTVALAGLKWDAAFASSATVPPPDAPMAVNVVTSASLTETSPSTDGSLGVREQLVRMTGGNDKLARSLVKTFLADAPKALQQIQSAYKRESEKLASAAHLLKGSLSISARRRPSPAARSSRTSAAPASSPQPAANCANLKRLTWISCANCARCFLLAQRKKVARPHKPMPASKNQFLRQRKSAVCPRSRRTASSNQRRHASWIYFSFGNRSTIRSGRLSIVTRFGKSNVTRELGSVHSPSCGASPLIRKS